MATSKLFKAAIAGFAVLAQATTNTLTAGVVSESDAKHSLEVELSTGSARLRSLEDALRTTFAALPKNEHGNLGHDAVRYALHRMFVQRHGWFIKGLEPGSERRGKTEDWVPSYLQAQLSSNGAGLHDLAALAAALEDLVDLEAHGRLGAAYDMLGFSKDTPIDEPSARLAVKTYYISFLMSGNFSANNRWETEQTLDWFTKSYENWAPADQWLHERMAPHFAEKSAFSFEDVAKMAEDIGENYFRFNDGECRDLKSTLGELEGIKAGRVRLSFFYSKSLHSHWRFNERPDYLRVLGALDDSEESSPQVIVPNYVMARPNCLEASGLYAICCRNECEDLMGSLEHQIGSSTADPKRIASLVSAMPSDTVTAPRELPSGLLTRLDEVAANNGGSVPLHGRLFAQWMHHAYPRECPYPHEASENPQTPDEWMAGQAEGAQEMSREEMRQTVEADTCASGLASGRLPRPEDCGSASGHELPWIPREELLVSSKKQADNAMTPAPEPEALLVDSALEAESDSVPGARWNLLDVVAAGALVTFLVFKVQQARHGRGSFKVKDDVADEFGAQPRQVNWSAVAGLGALAAVAYLLGLLDGVVFCCAAVAGLGSLVLQHFMRGSQEPALPLYGKSVV